MSGPIVQLTAAASGTDPREGAATDFYDEAFSAPATPRPHWEALFPAWSGWDTRDWRSAPRMPGACCASTASPVSCTPSGSGIDEPWQLDLLPLIIGSEEWRELEAGLIQRAMLLNLVLGDLYGTQRLVRDGFVPAPLVFANPAYLRPCQAHCGQGQDLSDDLLGGPGAVRRRALVGARGPHAGAGGSWFCHGKPVGAFPGAARRRCAKSNPVRFLIPCASAAKRCASSPREQADNPAIALLTPGPRNEAYFEHAYLSRLLGLTLVEGDDLTVRDRRLFIKTLDGLRRGGRVAAAGERRLLRPAGTARRFPAGRARPASRRRARATSASATPLGPACWKARRSCRFCRAYAAICWTRNCGCPRWPPGGAARRASKLTCVSTWSELVDSSGFQPGRPRRSHRPSWTPPGEAALLEQSACARTNSLARSRCVCRAPRSGPRRRSRFAAVCPARLRAA